jgi:hypothetical protein
MRPSNMAIDNTFTISRGIPIFNHVRGMIRILAKCVTRRHSRDSRKRKIIREGLASPEAMMLPTICTTAYRRSQPPICNVQYSLSLFTDWDIGLINYKN